MEVCVEDYESIVTDDDSISQKDMTLDRNMIPEETS